MKPLLMKSLSQRLKQWHYLVTVRFFAKITPDLLMPVRSMFDLKVESECHKLAAYYTMLTSLCSFELPVDMYVRARLKAVAHG